MSIFEKYYGEYMGTKSGFEKFHTEVLNIPRDRFSDTSLEKIRSRAGYLLMTENLLDSGGCNYKEVMNCMANELSKGRTVKYPDREFEDKYLRYDDLDAHYAEHGRMFRHNMLMGSMFGFVKSKSKQKKRFDYNACRTFDMSDTRLLMPIARNYLMSFNINHDNDFAKSLKGIEVTERANYRLTYSILRYIQERGKATSFELSVLLGRFDKLQNEEEILERAFAIGSVLPPTQDAQKNYFFEQMHWRENNTLYSYSNSQEPYFKFHGYLLFLEKFDLIKYDTILKTYYLTDYAKKLLSDTVVSFIVDLENLLSKLEDDSNKELNDLILYQKNPELLKLVKEDTEFVKKLNIRNLTHPAIDARTNKKARSQIIAEFAKIRADYKCEYKMDHVFKMPNGKYYCEAHHIIEFTREDGPDITNNIVVLGPEAHMIIHHAASDEVDNVYSQLIKNGVLPIERFKEMITEYHCLTEAHIHCLRNKKIISKIEEAELLSLLMSYNIEASIAVS